MTIPNLPVLISENGSGNFQVFLEITSFEMAKVVEIQLECNGWKDELWALGSGFVCHVADPAHVTLPTDFHFQNW